MRQKFKILIYYSLIKFLPHSRFSKISNKMRCWYVSKVLKILKSHPDNFFENNIYIGKAYQISFGANCQINENVFRDKIVMT